MGQVADEHVVDTSRAPLRTGPSGERVKAILAATVGNALEWYDFTLFGFFAATIAPLFFPSQDEHTSFLLTLATFGVALLVRPLGGLFFGAYSDRVGRKRAMALTVILMAIGTVMIGVMPTYATIGIWSTIGIVLARLIQGFSAGGELSGSTAMLWEFAPPGQKGFYLSWQSCGISVALLLGGLAGTVVSRMVGPESLSAWGWRIPFLLGAVIGPIGLYIRSRVQETPVFREERDAGRLTTSALQPIKLAFSAHLPGIAVGGAMVACGTIATYVVGIYMASYATRQLGLSAAAAFLATSLSGLVAAVSAPILGSVGDRVGYRRLGLAGAAAIFVAAYPAYLLAYENRNFAALLLTQGALSIIAVAYSVSLPVLMAERFPTAVRTTCLSVSYNVATMAFGGFAAFYVTLLISWTGNPLAPSFYLMFGGALGFLALLLGARSPSYEKLATPAPLGREIKTR